MPGVPLFHFLIFPIVINVVRLDRVASGAKQSHVRPNCPSTFAPGNHVITSKLSEAADTREDSRAARAHISTRSLAKVPSKVRLLPRQWEKTIARIALRQVARQLICHPTIASRSSTTRSH